VAAGKVAGVNGELAQVACLAAHGSSWLARSSHLAASALDRQNSTFQFVGSLRFAPPGLESGAHTVADWLRQLCDRGVSRLWLVIPEPAAVAGDDLAEGEHMLAGFVDAGRWGLLATGGQRLEAWRASWAVGDPDAPDRRIWSVTYQGAYVEHATVQRPDLRDAREHLAEALRSARDFASRQDLNPWPAPVRPRPRQRRRHSLPPPACCHPPSIGIGAQARVPVLSLGLWVIAVGDPDPALLLGPVEGNQIWADDFAGLVCDVVAEVRGVPDDHVLLVNGFAVEMLVDVLHRLGWDGVV
jgi:hypothetical protein